jgi:phage-related protein|nr:MAG TPA: minor tail protein [Caudoviricetes sp.]
MADGSIRIDATVSDEQAKKQIAQMTKDIEKQSAAVDKQAAKVQKLAEQWNKVAAGGTKGIKMQADLAATEKEAARLATRLDEVNAEIEKTQSDYSTKLKQAATGAIPQEEFSASAQKLSELVAESDKLAEALRGADDKAAKLRVDLAAAKEASVSSAEGQNVKSNLDNEQVKLENMRYGLKKSQADMDGFVNQTNSNIAKLKRVVASLSAGLKTSVGNLQKSFGSKLGAAIDKLKAKFSDFGRSSQKSMKKATGGVQSFGVRLRSIVAGALFFNLISKALTAMADRLGKALLANQTFAKSFGQVKSNLLTAFQPIYESIIPWLNKLMQALAQVTAQMAQFIASVFGTTAQQAQENAKELNKQTDALDSTASSAKKAEKALASFDTVQKLTNNSNNTTDPSAPKFDTDYSAVKNQTPQWLTDFWKVFQDSWAQYGQQTIESAKNALSALKDMVSAIGQSFMAIWTNGTGLETLNNIQLLLQTIFDLITAIATAFTNAWNTNNTGEQMLQSIMNLLNTIIQIITSIGQAFIAAWNDGNAGQIMLQSIMTLITTVVQAINAIGQAFLAAWNDGNAGQTMINTLIQMITAVVNLVNSIGQAFIAAWTDAGLGESIFSNILSIITNIENTIKSLAENLQSAWEYNGNGVAIWESILKIIDDVLAGIDKMSQATADWASGLNFEPLVTAFNNFMAALEPVVDLIMNGLAWAWENVLLPLASWTIEEATPAVLNLLAAALQAVYKVVSALAPILQTIWSIIKPIVQFIGFSVISIIKGLTDTITKLGDAISFVLNLISKIGSGIGSGISSLVGALGGGLSAFSLDSPTAAYALDIPALANGAVISPNSEFLALLGDQKSGVNVETPLSTMIDAFNAALDARGGTGNSSQPIELYIDGAKFARITGPYNSGETRRRGVSLVTGGA